MLFNFHFRSCIFLLCYPTHLLCFERLQLLQGTVRRVVGENKCLCVMARLFQAINIIICRFILLSVNGALLDCTFRLLVHIVSSLSVRLNNQIGFLLNYVAQNLLEQLAFFLDFLQLHLSILYLPVKYSLLILLDVSFFIHPAKLRKGMELALGGHADIFFISLTVNHKVFVSDWLALSRSVLYTRFISIQRHSSNKIYNQRPIDNKTEFHNFIFTIYLSLTYILYFSYFLLKVKFSR